MIEAAFQVVMDSTTRVIDGVSKTRLRRPEDVVVCVDDEDIARKWVEVICWLMSPTNRHRHVGFDYYAECSSVWRDSFIDIFLAMHTGSITEAQAMSAMLADGSVYDALPTIGAGKKAYQSWPWSVREKCMFGLAVVDSPDKIGGVVERSVGGEIVVESKDYIRSADIGIDPAIMSDILDPSIAVGVDHSVIVPLTAIGQR